MRLIDAALCILNDVLKLIKAQPSIDNVKHGHWVKGNSFGHATCSVCGAIIFNSYDGKVNKYCHRCGARMDGGNK